MADSEAVKRVKENLKKKPVFDKVMNRIKDRFWEIAEGEISQAEYEELFDKYYGASWDRIKDKFSQQEFEEFAQKVDEIIDDVLDEMEYLIPDNDFIRTIQEIYEIDQKKAARQA
jgi:hypothetical protein